jgi:hypothetical protein
MHRQARARVAKPAKQLIPGHLRRARCYTTYRHIRRYSYINERTVSASRFTSSARLGCNSSARGLAATANDLRDALATMVWAIRGSSPRWRRPSFRNWRRNAEELQKHFGVLAAEHRWGEALGRSFGSGVGVILRLPFYNSRPRSISYVL